MSYGALDAASAAIAAGLVGHGVGRHHRVAMALPRGRDAVAAMLGVWRAGAAFVPLDPEQPAGRLAEILADCAPTLILGAPGGAPGPIGGAPTLMVADLLRCDPAAAPELESSGEDAASIMYTSGSTGRPKGVVIPHRAILRLVLGADYVRLGPDETVLHMAPLAFDASTFEIWGALLNGGRLAVVEAAVPSLDAIAATIAEHRVTTAWLTAGLFHLIADCRMELFAPLRQLLAGGDVLSPSHVAAVLRAHPRLRLINGYGPTENTTFTCCHTVSQADLAAASVPIGSAISGSTVHILDAQLRPVPHGEVGQLCTGGDGVALGYLGRARLTSERFVPDPFSDAPGGLLYLTGDRARRREDGAILFLGRDDRQVKINGHRVELDAVECALRSVAGVRDAAAVAQPDARGGKRLVAYIAGDAADPLPALRAALPEWALPAAIVRMDALPLTANGKIDRGNLPAPPGRSAPPRPGGNQAEDQLAALVCGVLGVTSVGRDQNFFELGASSLQLIELHARITGSMAPDLPLLSLFAAPRISELARQMAPPDHPAKPVAADAASRAGRAAEAMRQARRGARVP